MRGIVVGFATCACVAHALWAAAESPPPFLLEWGSMGTGPGQFRSPQGIAVGLSNEVFVVDALRHDVQKFDSNGMYLGSWGGQGSLPGQFSVPYGIATAPDGTVYVSALDRRIQYFTPNGDYIGGWGTVGVTEGLVLDVAPDGSVYVADAEDNRIQRFTADGVFLLEWGTRCELAAGAGGGCIGQGQGQFNSPRGIAVDSDGNVYVSDSLNDRVQKFDGNGTFLGMWGWGPSSGDGQFRNPRGLSTDTSGGVYVTDLFNDRVQKFTPSGGFLTKWGSFGSGPGQFYRAIDVDIDGLGRVYVVDRFNHRIQKFGDALSGTVPGGEVLLAWTPVRNPTAPPVRLFLRGPAGLHGDLAVYDIRGRAVARLGDVVLPETGQEIAWDGKTSSGTSVGSGIYFVEARVGTARVRQRIVLLGQ